MNAGLNLGRIDLKAQEPMDQSALELNERGFLRINVRICFEPLNSLEDTFS